MACVFSGLLNHKSVTHKLLGWVCVHTGCKATAKESTASGKEEIKGCPDLYFIDVKVNHEQ